MSALSAPHGQLRPPGHPRESPSLCFCNKSSHYLRGSYRKHTNNVGTKEAFSSVLSHSTQTDRMSCVAEVVFTSFFYLDLRSLRKFIHILNAAENVKGFVFRHVRLAGSEICLDKY